MSKFCVVGDSGLLGQAFTYRLSIEKKEVLGISTGDYKGSLFKPLTSPLYQHKKIDVLQDREELFRSLKQFAPGALVNCAGLVDIGGCEKKPDLAKSLNQDLPGILAEFCSANGMQFVQISTDQVFDGKRSSPYAESDTVNPLHIYGKTKLYGERNAFMKCADALVLRTNIVGFRDKKDQLTFAEWLSRALVRNEPITLVDDFVTSSAHVDAVSGWVLKACERKLKGLYHFAARDSASKYEFGSMFAQKTGLAFDHVKRGKLKDLNLRPERAPYLALDVTKAEKALSISFETITEAINRLTNDFRIRYQEAGFE